MNYTPEDFVAESATCCKSQAKDILEDHGLTLEEFLKDCPTAVCESGEIDSQELVDWLGY